MTNRRPLVIALTGGIGSGKSTAVKLFANLGALTMSADTIAAELVQKDTPALSEIVNHFGNEVLNTDGRLERSKVREIVFSDEAERLWLENLLHPLILEETRKRIERLTGADYVLLEIPLLKPGSEYTELADRVLVIDVPVDVQAKRAASRDNSTEQAIHDIINVQPSREERLAIADDVIDNTGTLERLEEQVYSLHERYRQLARKH